MFSEGLRAIAGIAGRGNWRACLESSEVNPRLDCRRVALRGLHDPLGRATGKLLKKGSP